MTEFTEKGVHFLNEGRVCLLVIQERATEEMKLKKWIMKDKDNVYWGEAAQIGSEVSQRKDIQKCHKMNSDSNLGFLLHFFFFHQAIDHQATTTLRIWKKSHQIEMKASARWSIAYSHKRIAYHRDILRPPTLLKMPLTTMKEYILDKSFIKFLVFRKPKNFCVFAKP